MGAKENYMIGWQFWLTAATTVLEVRSPESARRGSGFQLSAGVSPFEQDTRKKGASQVRGESLVGCLSGPL